MSPVCEKGCIGEIRKWGCRTCIHQAIPLKVTNPPCYNHASLDDLIYYLYIIYVCVCSLLELYIICQPDEFIDLDNSMLKEFALACDLLKTGCKLSKSLEDPLCGAPINFYVDSVLPPRGFSFFRTLLEAS